jgi:long-chain acyl-CoA synthetase
VTVLDHIRAHASTRPDHPALVVDDGERRAAHITYGDLVRSFEERGRSLRAQGTVAGDRCGLVARQGSDFITAALGILAADLCLVPIPADSGPAVIAGFAAEARLQWLVSEAEDFRCRAVEDRHALDGRTEAALRELHPAYLRFTSGTTNRHKGVLIGHQAILERLANANTGLGIGPEDRIVWVLPLAHHFVVSILLYLRFGATILLPASSLAPVVLALATRENATVLYAAPFHYRLLAADGSALRPTRLRLAVATADHLRADVAERFQARCGVPIVQALGIIEVGLPVMNLASAVTKPEALGRPLPGYEVWLRSEDGRRLVDSSPERPGEICIRGSGMFDAYLDPWTPARGLLEPDGFRTGDYGWLDRDGDLHLVGRRANRVNMAGMKFFCEEVEAVLDAHPAVRRSRVMSRVHAHLGEIPVAEIVAADPAQPPGQAALVAYCRERLASYKIPRAFAFVEQLPLTPTGKLLRWRPAPEV